MSLRRLFDNSGLSKYYDIDLLKSKIMRIILFYLCVSWTLTLNAQSDLPPSVEPGACYVRITLLDLFDNLLATAIPSADEIEVEL